MKRRLTNIKKMVTRIEELVNRKLTELNELTEVLESLGSTKPEASRAIIVHMKKVFTELTPVESLIKSQFPPYYEILRKHRERINKYHEDNYRTNK